MFVKYVTKSKIDNIIICIIRNLKNRKLSRQSGNGEVEPMRDSNCTHKGCKNQNYTISPTNWKSQECKEYNSDGLKIR